MVLISANTAQQIAESIAGVNADEKLIRSSFYVALGRSINRVKAQINKEIAKELKLPPSVLKRRLLLYRQIKGKDSKIWIGIDDIEFQYLGNVRQSGNDVVVRGIKADNAYIDQYGNVRHRYTDQKVKYKIDAKVRSILDSRLNYYLDKEFKKNFEQILKYKLKK